MILPKNVNAKTHNEDAFFSLPGESPVIALATKICFAQIGRVLLELCTTNFTCILY